MILKNTEKNRRLAARILKNGGVGVVPSDTLYGLMGSAFNPGAVKKIYQLRKRNKRKPFLVLISGPKDLKHFGIGYGGRFKRFCEAVWPGAMTVVFPCRRKYFAYLHRGTNTIAFRVPKPLWLRKLLQASGPLVAPSANYEGGAPALTIRAAKKYFGDEIAFYLDKGRQTGLPSTVVRLGSAGIEVIRRGAAKIPAMVYTVKRK